MECTVLGLGKPKLVSIVDTRLGDCYSPEIGPNKDTPRTETPDESCVPL